MKKLWNDYGLGIVFLVQWIISTALYGVFLYLHQEYPSSFWWEFLSGLFENFQSEAYQVFMLIVASAYLIYKGSGQSKDSQDRLEGKVDALLAAIKGLNERKANASSESSVDYS